MARIDCRGPPLSTTSDLEAEGHRDSVDLLLCPDRRPARTVLSTATNNGSLSRESGGNVDL